jgi:hypothetical protein
MTPTAFEFTVTMPGDVRLLEAIRLLALQVAGYAKLTADATAALAADAERETQAAMTSATHGYSPIEVRFSGDESGVSIRITGAGHTRHVRHPVSA